MKIIGYMTDDRRSQVLSQHLIAAKKANTLSIVQVGPWIQLKDESDPHVLAEVKVDNMQAALAETMAIMDQLSTAVEANAFDDAHRQAVQWLALFPQARVSF